MVEGESVSTDFNDISTFVFIFSRRRGQELEDLEEHGWTLYESEENRPLCVKKLQESPPRLNRTPYCDRFWMALSGGAPTPMSSSWSAAIVLCFSI